MRILVAIIVLAIIYALYTQAPRYRDNVGPSGPVVEGPAEKAGRAVDGAMHEAGRAIERIGEKIQEKTDVVPTRDHSKSSSEEMRSR